MTGSDPFRTRLLEERRALLAASEATVDARAPVALDQQSVGRLSRQDALQGQAMAQALDVRRAGRLRAIDAALARMDDDDFGVCADCGEPIPTGRLRLDPCATRCVSCAG